MVDSDGRELSIHILTLWYSSTINYRVPQNPCCTGTKKSPSRKLCTWVDGKVMGAMDTVVKSELGVNCTPLQFACSKSNLLAKSVLDEARLVQILETHIFEHMHTDCLDKSDCGYIMLCLHVITFSF